MASHTLFADRRALEKEVAALGVNIRFERDIQASLTPLAIASRTVGNRFAIHPMEGCDGTLDGAPDELTFRRWARFGAGGAKLLWGEAVAIDPDAPREHAAAADVGRRTCVARTADRAGPKGARTCERLPRRPAAHALGTLVVPDARR